MKKGEARKGGHKGGDKRKPDRFGRVTKIPKYSSESNESHETTTEPIIETTTETIVDPTTEPETTVAP